MRSPSRLGPSRTSTGPRLRPATPADPSRKPAVRRRVTRVTRVTGVVIGLLALLLAPVVSVPVAERADAAPRASYRAIIVFEKSYQRQFDSRVTWRLFEQRGKKRTLVEERSWRAGGGLPRKGGTDACARSVGWAPDGSYRITLHRDYGGNVIKGGVFRMEDKACRNGTVRQNLFLHTEQGPGSRQCADGKGDQSCRWEWPRINDYKSNGCLKMAPRHLHELVRLYERRFAAGVQHPADRVVLRVR